MGVSLSNAASGYPACYDAFFGSLTGSINCGSGKWKAICPAHPDVIQSLSVRVGNNGNLWVRCHAGSGCPVDVIVRALRLDMDDLFADNKRYTKREGARKVSQVQTVYQYRDEEGRLLFEAIRRAPKTFRQRRPNPDFDPGQPTDDQNPEYLYNLEGVRRVLYKLPNLLSALSRTPQKMVFVLEGEKDVETAWAAGILATCNPMGAGKWMPEFSDTLKGCNVVVVADNDAPGLAHAKAVCDSLKAAARTVRTFVMPGAPDKGDFSEWWARVGGTDDQKKDTLKKLVNTTAPLYGTAPAAPAPKSEPKPEPKQEPTPVTTEPVPAPAEPAKPMTPEEKFPNSPTIAGKATEKTEPKTEPKPVPVEAPAAPAPVPAPRGEGGHSTDPKVRAARVATWFKDVKASASALKAANVLVRSPAEFYGGVRLAIAELDSAMRLEGGIPRLDMDRMSQVSLLLGAYLITAAADFGLGVGLIEDPKTDAAKQPG